MFTILHVPLFNQNKALFKKKTFGRMTSAEYMEYVAFEDPSLLLKVLFAFATGNMQLNTEKFQDSNLYRSEFMAVAVAKDMMQNITLGRPAPFQLMMSEQMDHYGVKAELRNFLSSIRVTASMSHHRRLDSERQAKAAKVKVATDVLDVASTTHFDNIGFKGRKKLWSQHCIVQVKHIPKEQLVLDGFYQGTLDRERLTFAELAETAGLDMDDVNDDPAGAGNLEGMDRLAEKVVAVTKEDKTVLSSRILKAIDCAVNTHLPSLNECLDLEREEISWDTRYHIPLHLGSEIVDPVPPWGGKEEKEMVAMVAELEKSEGKNKLHFGRNPTLYEANNIVLDNPLHEDPNAKSTVMKIMEYMEQFSTWEQDSVDFTFTNGENPVRDMFAPATCDGSPLKRFLDIIDEDRRRHRDEGRELQFLKARFFMGGMHYLMEVANMASRLSRDFLSYFVSDWRPTDPQLNWLLALSDPTDYVLEMPQFVLAHYRAAADALTEENGGEPVTAAEVHEHMLERAKEYPSCMAMLLSLRLIMIALMWMPSCPQ